MTHLRAPGRVLLPPSLLFPRKMFPRNKATDFDLPGRLSMKGQTLLVTMCALALAVPAFARDKKHANRAMIEKMEAVPCGAKERGLTGLGSVFGSIGATPVDSDETLCPH